MAIFTFGFLMSTLKMTSVLVNVKEYVLELVEYRLPWPIYWDILFQVAQQQQVRSVTFLHALNMLNYYYYYYYYYISIIIIIIIIIMWEIKKF